MAPRIDVTKYPDAVKAMYGLERIARQSGIDRKLLHLIKTRVSQINGCAYCVIAINGWNRLAIPFRADVGSYQPGSAENPATAVVSA